MVDEIFRSYVITPFPRDYSEAMAYVPYQSNNPRMYSVPHGFETGTLFPTLDKPFYGEKCMEEMKND